MSETELRAQLNVLTRHVHEIWEKLIGDLNNPGFLEEYRESLKDIAEVKAKLAELEKAVEGLKESRTQLVYWATGAGGVISIGWIVFTHFAK